MSRKALMDEIKRLCHEGEHGAFVEYCRDNLKPGMEIEYCDLLTPPAIHQTWTGTIMNHAGNIEGVQLWSSERRAYSRLVFYSEITNIIGGDDE